MLNLKALWNVDLQKSGQYAVKYQNYSTGKKHDCGLTNPGVSLNEVLEFVMNEGDGGDLLFLNGKFWTQLTVPNTPEVV